jgi:hypothetical protein
MSKSDKYQPVTFTNSLGEVISNDPVFRAQQVLEQAGLGQTEAPTPKAAKAVSTPPAAPVTPTDEDDEDLENDDSTEEAIADYKELDGKAAKALAAERGVDITGFTKVQQVRDALMAADAAKAEAQE